MRKTHRAMRSRRPGTRLHSVPDKPRERDLTAAVACLNLGPRPGAVEHNLRVAEQEIRQTKTANPDLAWVVLPELYTSGYSGLATIHEHAEYADAGVSLWHFTALARELGIYIAYGFPERLPDGGICTSANLIGPGDRTPLLTYRKMNLVRTTLEWRVFTPGTELPVMTIGGHTVALLICWDLGHPETVREAAARGADLVLAPAAWRDPWSRQYDLSCAARALDNAVHVASANQLGSYPEADFGAIGSLYGPDGASLSEGPDRTRIAHLDPTLPLRWRNTYGSTLQQEFASLEEAL